jgi:hypothetical protein
MRDIAREAEVSEFCVRRVMKDLGIMATLNNTHQFRTFEISEKDRTQILRRLKDMPSKEPVSNGAMLSTAELARFVGGWNKFYVTNVATNILKIKPEKISIGTTGKKYHFMWSKEQAEAIKKHLNRKETRATA